MAEFIGAAAVRQRSVEQVADAVHEYASRYQVHCEDLEIVPPPPPEEEEPTPRWPLLARIKNMFKEEEKKKQAVGQGKTDVVIFETQGDWTVLFWPPMFRGHDLPAARWLARQLDTTVSAIHVIDGAYWAHYLFDKGKEVDRFASRPDVAADSAQGAAGLARRYAGDAKAVARHLGVPADIVARYLVHVGPEGPTTRYPDDVYAVDDPWVFTDFWRHVGITYPENILVFERQLCLGIDFTDKLPAVGTNEL